MNIDLNNIDSKKILVLGDLMLDKVISGNANHISAEAPIPVIDVKSETFNPGGAANLAFNLSHLGADIDLCGLIGKDNHGEILLNLLKEKNIGIKYCLATDMPTITKVRIQSQNQMLARYDLENHSLINNELAKKILEQISSTGYDAVAISDYDKGINNPLLFQGIIKFCNDKKIPIYIDPKSSNISLYENASLVKANFKEALMLTGMSPEENIKNIAIKLNKDLNSNILITLSEKGLFFFDGSETVEMETLSKAVINPTGAGDALLAGFISARLCNHNIEDSLNFANHCASSVIRKPVNDLLIEGLS